MAKLHNIIYSDVIEVLYCPFWSHGAVYVGGGSLLVNIRWGGGGNSCHWRLETTTQETIAVCDTLGSRSVV